MDEAELDRYRWGPCEWCGKRGPTDPHHVFTKGLGGGHRLDIPENLVALCRADHSAHHAGNEPSRSQILAIVATRLACTVEDIVDKINELRRRPKP